VGLRAGLDAVETKILPCRKSNPGLSAREKEDDSKGKKAEEEMK
jgi:hypothetical protein